METGTALTSLKYLIHVVFGIFLLHFVDFIMSGQSWSYIGNINYEEFVGMLFKEVREIILMSSSQLTTRRKYFRAALSSGKRRRYAGGTYPPPVREGSI